MIYPKQGGVYFWYVTEEGASRLGVDISKCTQKGNKFLVYIGLAKNLNQRLDWHLNDKHSPSGIKSGFVSTLRQSLSALLVGEMVTAKDIVDNFMRKEMCVEFEVCVDYKEREIELIKEHDLPLNLRDNKHHPFYKTLKQSRKASKQKSLLLLSND
jgi:hypothetical protein